MSEHQRIAFRAIDGPVSDANLAYMRRQSSRAEITPWSFDNEYQFGDFHGDALEMLRRGYDLHLHYADFGIRKLLIRLPDGLPDPKAAKPYFGASSLRFLQDKTGPGGALCVQPFHEPGDLEDLGEFDELVDRLVPLRAEILDGDLRPLYLAHLAMACDGEHDPDETKEAPVPAGLEKLSDAQRALAELFSLSDSLIAAAALDAPSRAAPTDIRAQYTAWLQGQPQATKDAWLAQSMADANASVRREMLAEFRKSRNVTLWPTLRLDRTIAQLQATAHEIEQATQREAVTFAVRQKVQRLAAMAADPERTLKETEVLVKQQSTQAYRKIATLLADLHEALAGSEHSDLAQQQARKLKNHNPKLRTLVSELRRGGLLVK